MRGMESTAFDIPNRTPLRPWSTSPERLLETGSVLTVRPGPKLQNTHLVGRTGFRPKGSSLSDTPSKHAIPLPGRRPFRPPRPSRRTLMRPPNDAGAALEYDVREGEGEVQSQLVSEATTDQSDELSENNSANELGDRGHVDVDGGVQTREGSQPYQREPSLRYKTLVKKGNVLARHPSLARQTSQAEEISAVKSFLHMGSGSFAHSSDPSHQRQTRWSSPSVKRRAARKGSGTPTNAKAHFTTREPPPVAPCSSVLMNASDYLGMLGEPELRPTVTKRMARAGGGARQTVPVLPSVAPTERQRPRTTPNSTPRRLTPRTPRQKPQQQARVDDEDYLDIRAVGGLPAESSFNIQVLSNVLNQPGITQLFSREPPPVLEADARIQLEMRNRELAPKQKHEAVSITPREKHDPAGDRFDIFGDELVSQLLKDGADRNADKEKEKDKAAIGPLGTVRSSLRQSKPKHPLVHSKLGNVAIVPSVNSLVSYPPSNYPMNLEDGSADMFSFYWEKSDIGGRPTPRARHVSAIVPDGRMLVFGGSSDDFAENAVHLYNFEDEVWTHIHPDESSPSCRDGAAATLIGNTLVMYGGRDGVTSEVLNDLCVLNTDTWTWTVADSGGPPMFGHTLELLESAPNVLFLVGGTNINNMFVLDLDTLKFKEPTRFTRNRSADDEELHLVGPEPRRFHATASVGDKIYLFGGQRVPKPKQKVATEDEALAFVALGDFHFYDAARSLWKHVDVKGSPPLPRMGHTMSVVGESLVVFGGRTMTVETRQVEVPRDPFAYAKNLKPEYATQQYRTSRKLNDICVFSTKTNTWSRVQGRGMLPAPRDSHTAVGAGSTVVVFGGRHAHHTDEVFALRTGIVTVAGLQPVSGSLEGDTLVTIHGSGFSHANDFRIRLCAENQAEGGVDQMVLTAQVASETKLQFMTPPLNYKTDVFLTVEMNRTSNANKVTLASMHNNALRGEFEAGPWDALDPELHFHYYALPTIATITPLEVSTDGGEMLTLKGSGFAAFADDMCCHLNPLVRFVSKSGQIIHSAPCSILRQAQTVALEFSPNGQEVTRMSLSLKFVQSSTKYVAFKDSKFVDGPMVETEKFALSSSRGGDGGDGDDGDCDADGAVDEDGKVTAAALLHDNESPAPSRASNLLPASPSSEGGAVG